MLQVSSVSRSFGDLRAVDDVSFDVAPGRMTGFVGANGSGKTTTMRIILGVLGADDGAVTWRGDEVTQKVRQRFGYMPEERGLYPKMKVAEQVVYMGRLHGLDRTVAQRNATELLEQLEVVERAEDPVEQLSLGNQQRVQIAAALVHDPDLLILDEPFSGLDPLAIEIVLGVLRDRAARGVPVLFSSHQLEVVERLCDDLVIIAAGAVAASGSRDALRAQFGPSRFQLVVDEDAGWIRDLPGVRLVELDGPRAVFDLDDEADDGAALAGTVVRSGQGERDQAVLQAALQRGPVRGFGPVVPSLSEIFKEVV
ncbi:ABC transporter ATP-binding protein [Phytoactinopolyspora endophytica]|uniref:ABC transporter ATP-binding protein n=1 Tax=Phytoactinopolyspora endophytica TaxID=1642495 RepID=UPI00101BB174|nr:ATP-binding cassette domain-containing protein [Phytoactinopolyspora endophytica]